MRIKLFPAIIIALAICFCTSANAGSTGRITVSLDGQWRIAGSQLPDEIPTNYTHIVPVPGLANLAKPAFPNVDQFISREHLAKLISEKKAPANWMEKYPNGKVNQDRNYFWYRKTFSAPAARAVAMLKINKAQFGTAVWLNGQQLTPQDDAWHGEYLGCFSASYWDLSQAIHWNTKNTLVIRIGAHPAVLPGDFPTGADFEKIKWTPGIYDDVSVFFCNNPEIETVQIAPHIAADEIEVQTKLKNFSATPGSTSLAYTVKTWKSGRIVTKHWWGKATDEPAREDARPTFETISLQPGEEKTVTQTIKIPSAHWWSPEDPFLYVLQTTTDGDSMQTRFGMREFHYDAATKRAWLNGKIYYLRGSNITLHRFFEDPLCGNLPWNDVWVRKLLGDIPKKMHWNYFRFCIGPVPDHWFDICDEVGLLIQNEFPIWTGGTNWYKPEHYSRTYDTDETIRQYTDWMRDNWNHPSLAVWDANNETQNPIFGEKIIPALRGLDLSNRAWENSYNQPAGSNDMVEYHPYFEHSGYHGISAADFKMSDLENLDGRPDTNRIPSQTNPLIINEYGWLWLNRDGSPTELTKKVYATIAEKNFGPGAGARLTATPRERLDLWAYLLAGETEFWRTHRQFAGIVHFVYLTCSYPGVYTSDNWSDVRKLKLDPAFADYMGEAFKPLGVYINFFHPTLKAGDAHEFLVKMVNDYDRPISGRLIMILETKKGKVLAKAERTFAMKALGAGDFPITLPVPNQKQSDLILKATAMPESKTGIGPTISRRWLSVRQ